MKSSTQNFYDTNAASLLERYELAEMSIIHDLLLSSIPSGGTVLDIGFGSGRDLSYLMTHGYNIYGIDPTEAFVNQAKNRFVDIADHFILGSFLSHQIPSYWPNTFDAVISIAVLMHLKTNEHAEAIEVIKSLIKPNGIVVLSFSLGERDSDDGRHFEPLVLKDVVNEFSKAGFTLMNSVCTDDSLGRDSIEWATVILRK